jgi:hypothetical protein
MRSTSPTGVDGTAIETLRLIACEEVSTIREFAWRFLTGGLTLGR